MNKIVAIGIEAGWIGEAYQRLNHSVSVELVEFKSAYSAVCDLIGCLDDDEIQQLRTIEINKVLLARRIRRGSHEKCTER